MKDLEIQQTTNTCYDILPLEFYNDLYKQIDENEEFRYKLTKHYYTGNTYFYASYMGDMSLILGDVNTYSAIAASTLKNLIEILPVELVEKYLDYVSPRLYLKRLGVCKSWDEVDAVLALAPRVKLYNPHLKTFTNHVNLMLNKKSKSEDINTIFSLFISLIKEELEQSFVYLRTNHAGESYRERDILEKFINLLGDKIKTYQYAKTLLKSRYSYAGCSFYADQAIRIINNVDFEDDKYFYDLIDLSDTRIKNEDLGVFIDTYRDKLRERLLTFPFDAPWVEKLPKDIKESIVNYNDIGDLRCRSLYGKCFYKLRDSISALILYRKAKLDFSVYSLNESLDDFCKRLENNTDALDYINQDKAKAVVSLSLIQDFCKNVSDVDGLYLYMDRTINGCLSAAKKAKAWDNIFPFSKFCLDLSNMIREELFGKNTKLSLKQYRMGFQNFVEDGRGRMSNICNSGPDCIMDLLEVILKHSSASSIPYDEETYKFWMGFCLYYAQYSPTKYYHQRLRRDLDRPLSRMKIPLKVWREAFSNEDTLLKFLCDNEENALTYNTLIVFINSGCCTYEDCLHNFNVMTQFIEKYKNQMSLNFSDIENISRQFIKTQNLSDEFIATLDPYDLKIAKRNSKSRKSIKAYASMVASDE